MDWVWALAAAAAVVAAPYKWNFFQMAESPCASVFVNAQNDIVCSLLFYISYFDRIAIVPRNTRMMYKYIHHFFSTNWVHTAHSIIYVHVSVESKPTKNLPDTPHSLTWTRFSIAFNWFKYFKRPKHTHTPLRALAQKSIAIFHRLTCVRIRNARMILA